MLIDDINYSLDVRNVPGRSALVAIADLPFTTGTIAAGGADVNLKLPQPPTGFARVWQSLSMIWTVGGLANLDNVFFTRANLEGNIGQTLVHFTGVLQANIDMLPLINCVNADNNISASTAPLIGYPGPLICANESVLGIFVDYVAPTTQAFAAAGWYKDIPF